MNSTFTKSLKHIYLSKDINQNNFEGTLSLLERENILISPITHNPIDTILQKLESDKQNILFLTENDIKSLTNSTIKLETILKEKTFIIIPVNENNSKILPIDEWNIPSEICYQCLSIPFQIDQFKYMIDSAFNYLKILKDKYELEASVKSRSKEIEELTEIGKALSSEHNYNKLLKLILDKGKSLIQCDAASIYIVENSSQEKYLNFKLSDLILTDEGQNLPLNKESIAGYVALTGYSLNIEDAYEIPPNSEYKLNLNYDKKFNYRTKSMLVIPMKDHEEKIIGVLQFINKKRHKSIIFTDIESIEKDTIPFNPHDVELTNSLAGQAAVAIVSSSVEKRAKEIRELTNIGKALATERNHLRLLNFILRKSKEITNCDSGTIYLVDKDEKGETCLRFKMSSLDLEQNEFTFPINRKSISGYVALTGKILNLADAYHLPEDAEYTLNLSYDKKHNYRTKSMLVVPMTNQKNEVIGILQLINKKNDKDIELTNISTTEKNVISFDDHDIELVTSIGGQAAVAIENNILYQNIENLFEGFVKASVTAIESRDPTTSGHSERVAVYTVELAKLVDKLDTGLWKDVRFSRDQIKEIRYASLLHDFGKVGVREKVLVKSKKLYFGQLELIKLRFDFIKRTLQYESSQRKIEYLLQKSREEAVALITDEEQNLDKEIKEIDTYIEAILTSNEPLVLASDVNCVLQEIAKKTFLNVDNTSSNYLEASELRYLSIRKGSLQEEERREIESHVTHTFEFLSKIPWTTELKSVPIIAYAHHEKLNGDGYPRAISEIDIPLQSRIMTISDIFDALVASDRPYKKAVSLDKALNILQLEVKDQHVDPELVELFIDAKIFNSVNKFPNT